ncbi:MAG: hypothetical protein JO345_34940 [Streptosporangiaceae bacterium]|nr:hypothetical protein [Streptosporangiaceae bacterium]
MKLVNAAAAIVGMSLLGVAACGGSVPPAAVGSGNSAPMMTYAEASCSSLHAALTRVERDAAQQEQFIAANPSYSAPVIAAAWLPPGTYSKDLEALATAVQPYGDAPGNEVSQVTNDAGVLNTDLSKWFGGTSPGPAEPLPNNWQMDFSDFQGDIWTLASACHVQQGTPWGVVFGGSSTTPASPSISPTVTPAPSATSPAVTPPPSSPAAQGGCYPRSNEGTCYEPGEFCRKADHGASGIAGDGKAITCEDNDGWRWEPS